MDRTADAGERRLAAITFADIVGYSAISSQDEDRAIAIARALQARAHRACEHTGGRIVKSLGDGVLLEHGSAESAARAALDLLAFLPGDAADDGGGVQLRIGIHVGDVLCSADGDVYGDGVNTAARLQAAAEPGEVLVGESFWRQLRHRREFTFEDRGERELKGLAAPERTYVLLPAGATAGAQPAARRHGSGVASARRRVARRAVAAGGLIVVIAASGYLLMRHRSAGLAASGALGEARRVVLADLSNTTTDSLLGHVVAEALRVDLLQSDAIRPLDPAIVSDAMRRMGLPPGTPLTAERARDLAMREGLAAVLAGDVAHVGGGYVLSITITSASDGRVMAGFRESVGSSSDLIPAIGRLSRDIRRRAGESLADVRASEPLERVTTVSLEALRAYTRGVRAANIEGDFQRASEFQQLAVELDPEFAMAYRHLYISLEGSQADPEQRVAAAQRAFELRDRMTEAERIQTEAFYYTSVERDPAQALRAYRRGLALDPTDPRAANNLGLWLNLLGEYGEAEAIASAAIKRDSLAAPPLYWVLSHALAGQRRLDETDIVVQRGAALFPNSWGAQILAGDMLAARGQYAAAHAHFAQTLDRIGASRTVRDGVARRQAQLDAIRGRVAEARQHLTQLYDDSRQLGSVREAWTAAITRATFTAEVGGDTTRARAELERAAQELAAADGGVDPPRISLAAFHARTGDATSARRLLQEYRAGSGDTSEVDSLHMALGWLALAEGRPDRAIEEFATAMRYPRNGTCRLCLDADIGRAHELAGRPDSAVAAYTRYLTEPSGFRPSTDERTLGRVLLRLAELHDARGENPQAGAYYARLTELWRDADPSLQPLVARAAGRLSAPDR